MQVSLKKGNYQHGARPGGVLVQFELKEEGKEPQLINLAIPTGELCIWLDDIRGELANRVNEWMKIQEQQREMLHLAERIQAVAQGKDDPIPF